MLVFVRGVCAALIIEVRADVVSIPSGFTHVTTPGDPFQLYAYDGECLLLNREQYGIP